MRTATTWLIYKSNIEERLNAFFHARTSQRLSLSAINMDELDAVTPILIDYIGLRRLNASVCLLTVDCYVKHPNLLDFGSFVGPSPSDLVLAEA